MGSVVTRDQLLHHKLYRMHAIQGISVSGDDTAQIQRSLAHMSLRYEQQSKSAMIVLDWLKQQPQFSQVLHPSNPDVAGHQFWAEICRSFSSLSMISQQFVNSVTA